MEREKLKSRLGFILLSAGCAIGIGNVWKFPYMAGQGGGGAFVLFYLLFLVILVAQHRRKYIAYAVHIIISISCTVRTLIDAGRRA